MKCICLTLLLISSSLIQAQGVLHEIHISKSEEDAEQEGEFIDLDDLELDIGWDHGEKSLAGLFFRAVNLDQGAQVQSANLLFTAQTDLNDSLELIVRLENNPFPEGYSIEESIVSDRVFLSSTVSWIVEPVAKNKTRISPDLSSMINELLVDPNWESSSNLNFIIEPKDIANDSIRLEWEIYSYDQTVESSRPRLRLFVDSNFINSAEAPVQNQTWRLYPNPASNSFHVHLDAFEPLTIHVSDLRGHVVLSQAVEANTEVVSIDISSLSSGIYMVYDSEHRSVSRLVVDH